MELQRGLERFRAAGIRVFAISYDSIETISTFCGRYGVDFDFLSDDGSKVIRQLGILNTLVRPDESVYGIPYPGTYVLDASGLVIAKFFNREYQVRESVGFLLQASLGETPEFDDTPRGATEAGAETPVRVSARLTTPDLKFRQRTELIMDLTIAPGFHVYGQPVPDGYIATEVVVTAPDTVRVAAPEYPPSHPFRIEGLDEEFHVLDGQVRFRVELNSLLREGDAVPVEIEVRYQACTDTECLVPATARLHLDLPVGRLTPQAT